MKIALVTEFFFPTTGGTQTVVASLAERLAGRGRQVTVLAPLADRSPWPAQPEESYTVRWFRLRSLPFAGYLLVQRAIGASLGPFEVIHLFHPAFGLGALWATRRPGQRFVATLMGYDTYAFHAMPWLKRRIALAACRQADALTAPSNDLARLASETGVRREIEIIPHGISPALAAPDRATSLRRSLGIEPGQTVFVAVQRHCPIKEPAVFLDAWQRLARPDCRLILVGGGELEPVLRRRADMLNLGGLTVVGEVPREDVITHLAVADVFVHHSHYESFGLGIVEAMQAGLPVIACAVGAVPEIVTDGVEGLLIPPLDPEAMAEAMARLADSATERARLGAAARERSSQFHWDRIVEQYERLYEGDLVR